MEVPRIVDNGRIKMFMSPDYNYLFDRESGRFDRWGATKEDDPDISKYGPEILDLEISEGECSGRCPFCYKDNGDCGGKVHNMTIDEFKEVLKKMPPTLTQIAFGICDVDTNPDFPKMIEYARSKGVIPNFTCNGLKVSRRFAVFAKKNCGACAVSIVNKESSYNAIQMFVGAGMDQVNIHYMLSEQTYERAFKIIDDMAGGDERLNGSNAIVFLQYKHKNTKSPFTSMLDKEKYKKLIQHCLDKDVSFGFDSCSANLIINVLMDMDFDEQQKQYLQEASEPCESSCFSSYINCHGDYFPCSFTEGMNFRDPVKGNRHQWETGKSIFKAKNFMEIWNHAENVRFRQDLLANNRNCPIYKI